MDRKITEGFDAAFAEIGFDYDAMSNLNKVADAVSNALYELHDIMQENNLYEKYPMQDNFGKEGTVFDEYNSKLHENTGNALTVKTDYGHEFVSVTSIGRQMAESSLKAMAEVLQETLGKEYGIDFSYTHKYNESKLMVGKYEYQEEYIRESVNEILEKSEYERE